MGREHNPTELGRWVLKKPFMNGEQGGRQKEASIEPSVCGDTYPAGELVRHLIHLLLITEGYYRTTVFLGRK